MWKRLNSNQMCEQFSYKEVFLIKRFLIERFYYISIFTRYRNTLDTQSIALYSRINKRLIDTIRVMMVISAK